MHTTQVTISSHHIGGRGGTGSKNVPEPFANDLHHVYYEADADCTEQIEAVNPDRERVTVLPLCIGRHNGTAPFHIDYDPCMSSLLPLNPDYGDLTLFLVDPLKGPLDYCFADTGRTMERREIEVVSLDSLYLAGNPPAPLPDLLSMDTQGSEFQILQGAVGVLKESVLALRLEVAFQPIYQDQKLFGDLCAFLSDHGFQFMKMLDVYDMFPAREPLGLRAGSLDAFGEALFFRTSTALRQTEKPEVRYLRLSKMAFIALTYGQLEIAVQCLRDRGAPPKTLSSSLALAAYPAFLDQLAAHIAAHPKVFPPLFSQRYRFAESRARFNAGAQPPTMEDQFVAIVDRVRRDVASRGGKRLCVLPFGLYARKLVDLPDNPEQAPVAFFDNGFQKHAGGPTQVHPPTDIGPDDFVIILSETYGQEIEQQIIGIRGDRPDRTLGYKELISGRWAFDQKGGETPVEHCLAQYGFNVLATRVRELRIAQTHQQFETGRLG